MGYGYLTKNYRLYNPETRHVVISKDVNVLEKARKEIELDIYPDSQGRKQARE